MSAGWKAADNLHCIFSCFSCVQLCATPWTIAHQAPLSTGFSRQEYWSGLPFPPPGDLLDSGIELAPLMSPALAGGFFTTSAAWETHTERASLERTHLTEPNPILFLKVPQDLTTNNVKFTKSSTQPNNQPNNQHTNDFVWITQRNRKTRLNIRTKSINISRLKWQR